MRFRSFSESSSTPQSTSVDELNFSDTIQVFHSDESVPPDQKGPRLSIPNALMDFEKISFSQYCDILGYFIEGIEIAQKDWNHFVSIGFAEKTDQGYTFKAEYKCEVLS